MDLDVLVYAVQRVFYLVSYSLLNIEFKLCLCCALLRNFYLNYNKLDRNNKTT